MLIPRFYTDEIDSKGFKVMIKYIVLIIGARYHSTDPYERDHYKKTYERPKKRHQNAPRWSLKEGTRREDASGLG